MSMAKNKQQSFGFFAQQNNRSNRSERPFFTFDPIAWVKKTVIRAAICLILFGLVFTIKLINVDITNNIITELSYRLNQEFNYRESYALAKGWGVSLLDKGEEAIETLNFTEWNQRQFAMPLEGMIVTNFNEVDTITGKPVNGIVIEGVAGDWVTATDEGVVIEVNSSQGLGHYIIIKHRGEFVSVYKYLQQAEVEVNTKVVKGETIGISSNKLLFEIWQRQNPINPMDYIDQQQINL